MMEMFVMIKVHSTSEQSSIVEVFVRKEMIQDEVRPKT